MNATEAPKPRAFRDWRCADCGAFLLRYAVAPGAQLVVYCRRCKATKTLQVT